MLRENSDRSLATATAQYFGYGRDAAKGAYHNAMYITVILFLTTIYDKKYADHIT